VLPVKWTLDVTKLRLAMRALQQFDTNSRMEHLKSLDAILRCPSEPYRWCLLQQSLGRIGRDPMVNTLVWCLVAYHVRVASPSAVWTDIETELHGAEEAVVRAIRSGCETEAEHHLRRGQALITSLSAPT